MNSFVALDGSIVTNGNWIVTDGASKSNVVAAVQGSTMRLIDLLSGNLDIKELLDFYPQIKFVRRATKEEALLAYRNSEHYEAHLDKIHNKE